MRVCSSSILEAWKRRKEHQGPSKEDIETQNRNHKNQTIQFWKPDYLIFSEQLESD
jgi:hypothetical protein